MTQDATNLQDVIIDKSLRSIEGGRDVFIEAPTGAGKSRKFSRIAAEIANGGGRVLVMAARQNLVLQGMRNMSRWADAPVETSFGMDGHIDQSASVVYTTVQTAHDLKDHLGDYDVAIVDEGHHARRGNVEYMETISALERRNPGMRLIAVSATPPPMMRDMHPRLAVADKHVMTFQEAIGAKLVDLPQTMTPPLVLRDGASAREIVARHRTSSKSAALEGGIARDLKAVQPDDWIHQIANGCERFLDDRRTLAFADTIRDATEFVNEMRERGVEADIVHSKRGLVANEATLDAFRDGRSRLLVSVDMISEGVDLDADGILLFKRTTSPDEYKQIIGRESRSHGVDRERKALLLDYGASTFMHGEIMAQAAIQTMRGEIERATARPEDLLPDVGRRAGHWIELKSSNDKRSVYGTSLDGAIIYASPIADRYAVFRSHSDRKGARFDLMEVPGERRKGMATRRGFGEWMAEAVRRNERDLSRLVGNVASGVNDMERMVSADWSRNAGSIERNMTMLTTPPPALSAHRAGAGR